MCPVNQVAERAFPEAAGRPVGIAPHLGADHKPELGFDVTITAGREGYLDLGTDEGSWEWEPESYVQITFGLDNAADARWAVTNVLTVVRRVLDTGREDAAFDFNGDILLFSRQAGRLVKHRRDSWWERYSAGDQVIPG
ncbi:hypothetical protein Aab01nite_37500 [Paractinoplanes abujensis]|uniref:Uncharacterized protein n=1 Tax=Paractinoplanes abujensis TaxID=882441 RepID=A0A7W7CX43_9ACTN|nr:SitI3 family protein [Actinoplanes abujensis]MBB4694626.1 hypothetical protein [Actinoplanes abujensis]GID20160.1 hypothetical protein Aab01nite_37500 [Actinoplanes abujensis]